MIKMLVAMFTGIYFGYVFIEWVLTYLFFMFAVFGVAPLVIGITIHKKTRYKKLVKALIIFGCIFTILFIAAVVLVIIYIMNRL
ncbi:MAG: hypothetical protein ACI4J7_03295 [Ruminiclostridium sp.]